MSVESSLVEQASHSFPLCFMGERSRESLRQLSLPVPQVVLKTGLSADYMNELAAWGWVNPEDSKTSTQWVEWAMEDFEEYLKRGYLMRTYRARFPETKYGNVVNACNERGVVVLDGIVNDLQTRFDREVIPLMAKYKNGTFSADDKAVLKAFVLELRRMMYRVRNILDGVEKV